MENLNLKKIFLHTLIGSIAVSALLGIWAILSGDFGEFQGKVLGTTLTVVGTSILGLACGAFLESSSARGPNLKRVPVIGIILALISAITVLLIIWGSDSLVQDKVIWKTFGISGVFASSLAQLSLLSLATLSKRFQWVLSAVYVAALSLAAILSVLILLDTQTESNIVMRTIGVLAVVDASLTVMIPVFHRLSRGDLAGSNVAEIDEEIAKLKSRIESLERQREKITAGSESAGVR